MHLMHRIAFIAVFVLAAAGFAAAGEAEAHFVGNSWEFRSGTTVVDIGYDTATFVAGSYVRFDFGLKNTKTLNPRDFAQVWVRIVEGERQTLLATGLLHQNLGPTTLLYVFPESGSYTLEASYRDASGADIATSSFPIVVQSGTGFDYSKYALTLVGFLLGAGICFLYFRFRAMRHTHE